MASALAGALLLAASVSPLSAQQDPQAVPQQAPAPAGDRVGRLEQNMADLQAMVAALESLVRTQPSAVLPQESMAPSAQSFDNATGVMARVDALETRIGALTSQLELLTQQLRQIEARQSGGDAPQPLAPPPQGGDPLEPLPELPGRQGLAPEDPAGTLLADAGGMAGFGTGTPPQSDEAGAGPMPLAAPDRPQRLAALPPGLDAPALYSQGYGDLLRRDYAAAEAAFQDLVQRFPADPLAGKAQYWLGESYYVRGQFKNAADAFLKGYTRYGSGDKAPDSLLKLGMALAALGQKDAACDTFDEFGAKFPAVDPVLREEARSERRKVRC
ncbi:MAG: tol-pal system protein YbgF [Methyloceanibacter sp.]